MNVLREGGLAAMLTYIAFFPTSIQRIAMTTVARLVGNVPDSCVDMVITAIPLVVDVVESCADEKMISQIALFFSRSIPLLLTPARASDLDRLGKTGLVSTLVKMVTKSLADTNLYTHSTVTSLIAALVGMSRENATVSCSLVELGIVPTVVQLAERASGIQLHQLLSLGNELLPDVPETLLGREPHRGLCSVTEVRIPTPPVLDLSEPEGQSQSISASDYSTQTIFSDRSVVVISSSNPPSSLTSYSEGLLPVNECPSISSSFSTPASPEPDNNQRPASEATIMSSSSPMTSSSANSTLSPTNHSSPELQFLSVEPPSDSSRTSSPSQMEVPAGTLSSSSIIHETTFSPFFPSCEKGMGNKLSQLRSMNEKKSLFFNEDSNMKCSVCKQLMELFVKAFTAAVSAQIRYKCVSGMLRIICMTDEAMLSELVEASPVSLSLFLSNLLSLSLQTSDYPMMASAVRLVDTSLIKLPSKLHQSMIREGVVEKLLHCAGRCSSPKLQDLTRRSPISPAYSSPVRSPSLMSPSLRSTPSFACSPASTGPLSPFLHPLLIENADTVRRSALACINKHYSNFASPKAQMDTQATASLRSLANKLSEVKELNVATEIAMLQDIHRALVPTISSRKHKPISSTSFQTHITTHEFVRSGIISRLNKYLTEAVGPQPARSSVVLARQRLFCNVFFGLPAEDKIENDYHPTWDQMLHRLTEHDSVEKIVAFIRHLVHAFESVERCMPVIYEVKDIREGPDTNPKLNLLSQPFTLTLVCRQDQSKVANFFSKNRNNSGSPSPPAFPPRTVLTDSLATVASIESYLLGLDGVNAIFSSSLTHDVGGPCKKKSRRSSSRCSRKSRHRSSDLKSYDDIEEDDFILQVKKAMEVSKPIKLGFMLNGKRIPSDMVILRAIQESGDFTSDAAEMWGKPHELVFFRDETTLPSVKQNSLQVHADLPPLYSLHTSPGLAPSIKINEVDCSDMCESDGHVGHTDILKLLRLLFDITQEWPMLYPLEAAEYAASAPLIPSKCFVSDQLSRKLQMQLEEPLVVCSSSLPRWCTSLANYAPFLFRLSTRQLMFRVTAFHPAQHLHALKGHFEKSGAQDGTEVLYDRSSQGRNTLPVHRIQHLKIRVSRNNVLDASYDLLKSHAKKRGFIRGQTCM